MVKANCLEISTSDQADMESGRKIVPQTNRLHDLKLVT